MNQKGLFRQESVDAVETPEKLDEYVRAVRPRAWLVVVAVLLLLVALLLWSLLGTVRSTFPLQGVQEDRVFSGYILPRDALEIQLGMTVLFPDGTEGVVSDISHDIKTSEEIIAEVNNAMIVANFDLHDLNLKITVDCAEARKPAEAQTAQIVLREITPMDFLMGG